MKVLAVDIGASSGRTIVGEFSADVCTLTETSRFENAMVDVAGRKHWDVEALVANVKAGIDASGPVDAIGIDTWGVDYGLLDADGKLIGMPYAYRDARNDAAMPVVYERISKDALYGIAGLQEMSFNTVFQVMADKMARPDVLAKASRLLLMPELVAYLLTGVAKHEYTICSTTALLDAKTRTWSDELIETLGYPRHLFGEVYQPGEPCGSYKGTPVFLSGGHDTASAVVAVPATSGDNWAYLSSGTWSLIGVELDQPVLTDAARNANFTNEGGADGKIRFLKNINGMWLINECQRIWKQQGQTLSAAAIAQAATDSDYAGTFDPAEPQFLAPEDMVATIAAALTAAGHPAPAIVGDTARACYLSLAQAYKRELAGLTAVTGKSIDRLHIVGGGCQATLLNQFAADACGIPVVTGPIEATAIGNMALVAMAAGHFANLTEVRAYIAKSFACETYTPTAS